MPDSKWSGQDKASRRTRETGARRVFAPRFGTCVEQVGDGAFRSPMKRLDAIESARSEFHDAAMTDAALSRDTLCRRV